MARLFLFLALALAGCNASPDRSMEAPSMAGEAFDRADESAPSPAPTTPAAFQADADDVAPDDPAARHLIRRATLRLRVDDYPDARAEVAALAERFDAYIGGEEERRYPGRIENTLTLRVEAARFEALMEALVALGDEVDARTVAVEDVTRQYVDLEARLAARRAVADRLTTLLARANSVTDVLAVQTQLAEVQEEIEAAEAQLRYLRNQVALSTITLTLFEESSTGVLAGPSFVSRLGRAFAAGWDGVIEVLVGVVVLWPLWVLGVAAVLLYRRLRRRKAAAPLMG